jgi:gamma-glutamyltranspeptidase
MRVTVQNIIVRGVFLNNEMDDFSAKAGVPTFGLVVMKRTALLEKRMLSSMTPTIVKKRKAIYVRRISGGSISSHPYCKPSERC